MKKQLISILTVTALLAGSCFGGAAAVWAEEVNLPQEAVSSKKYLEQFVKDKVVRCDIVAYTYQDIATALCYVDDDSINQRLVDEEFSRNVAL